MDRTGGVWSGLSAELLRQLDDDLLWAADVAEPIAVYLALHLANELCVAGSQAGDDGIDVVDRECEMAEARGCDRQADTCPSRGFWIRAKASGQETAARRGLDCGTPNL
jgi:hypothetical protein